MADSYACLLLPFPVSVDAMYDNNNRGGRGRRPSKRYEQWKAEAYRHLLEQAPAPRIAGPINVTYSFGKPDNRKRDVFNLEKGVSDFLVDHGVIEDDSLIQRGTVQWDDAVVGCRVEVEAT